MAPLRNDLTGVLPVDKPADWTSHDVVAKIKNVFKLKKIGHAGTLDPMATGVLVILCGRATKLSDRLMAEAKTYFFKARFGLITTTQDTSGEILEERAVPNDLTAEKIKAALSNFQGEISQLPPMYSAIKVNGQRLYKLARRGAEIEREPRKIFIYSFQLVNFAGNEAAFLCRCSKGTYVRTLAHDLGLALGCGAALSELRRTEGGGFTSEEAFPLEEILKWDLETFQEKSANAYAKISQSSSGKPL